MTRLFDWMFRDRTTGAVVIGQWPNAPLWLFVLSAGSLWIVEAAAPTAPDWTISALRLVSVATLTVWALDELVRGVNPWRRCLGGGVLLFQIWRLASGA